MFCECGSRKKIKKKGLIFVKSKEYSRSTNISNTREIYNNLSESNQLIMEAAFNMLVALFRNVQQLQGGTNQNKRKDKSE